MLLVLSPINMTICKAFEKFGVVLQVRRFIAWSLMLQYPGKSSLESPTRVLVTVHT